uniref:EGF-like domain-containing protein n=1 Tax=Strongyloides stercoralis TaxID=6248 RepID=A0A0K0DXZ1_STRER
MEKFYFYHSLFVCYIIILLFSSFFNLNDTLTNTKNERFSIKIKQGQVIFDETEGKILPNDYEFLLSPDAEDDVPDRIYEDIFPDLPPHDYILRGKYMGQVESKFVTPQPITTKFPHTKPPIKVPQDFKNDKEKHRWLSSLHDTLFPDDSQSKSNNKNKIKFEQNVPLKIKSGGQERSESKLVVQQVTTDLNITNKNEEKNNFNGSLKSKNLIDAVNEIIENNKKNSVDNLTNDYNDNISFNEALKLAEAEAKRVLEDYKRRENEAKIRKEEEKKGIVSIKNSKHQSTTPKSFLKEENLTDIKLTTGNETNIFTTTKSNIIKVKTNINNLLLSRLPDPTTTIKPQTTKIVSTITFQSNKKLLQNRKNTLSIKENKINNDIVNPIVSNFGQSNKIETTTISIIGNSKSSNKTFEIVITTTNIPLLKNSKCPTLNAYRDGKPHPQTSKFCQTNIPGIPNDNTCKCRYLVGSRDSNNCPSSFLYLCKPTAG